jgi:SAM-dependent methyltransferase
MLKRIFLKIFADFKFNHKLKKEVLGQCRTVLDLGCGKNSPLKFFSDELDHSLGVDNFLPYIEESNDLKIHSSYINEDILNACKKLESNSFDCVLALDVIEHFDKTTGLMLIAEMERIAKKCIVIYTPNGFLCQHIYDDNVGQMHLSGWTAGEFRSFGFKVYGMSGMKYLRTEFGEIKYRPKFFWSKIASLTQILAYFFPTFSFQLLCVKFINK